MLYLCCFEPNLHFLENMTVFIQHAGELITIEETLECNTALEVILIHSFLLGYTYS